MKYRSLISTGFQFPAQKSFYKGKVRDVYKLENDLLIMIITDRISAFDVVLPKGIPFKGQVLNQIANKFLDATSDIIPNWKIHSPDPMVTIGHLAEPFKIEMVIRGYLSGHAWRIYKAGSRTICGISLPERLRENDKLPEPIITPATKSEKGHDEDISGEEILKKGIIKEEDYLKLENYTRKLFERGSKIAEDKGLILADTKYEFGKLNDEIILIDEIHTPDSSRYFYLDTYDENQKQGKAQRQLSKEFVRQWLIERNYQGQNEEIIPEMTDDFVNLVSERYIELYENITGDKFVKADTNNIEERIYKNIMNFLKQMN